MTKQLLICNPRGYCGRCPSRHYLGEEKDESVCEATQKTIPEGVKVPEWCPLKDFPERMKEDSDFAKGWNAALDSIDSK